jgi:tetratricopeptide (TPR) repeat protein
VEKSLLGHIASPTLYSGAGAAYQESGQYEQAILNYNQVLATRPANSSIHYNLAICLMQVGRNAEAEQHFRQALAGTEGGVHVLCGLGSLLQRLGRTDEAIVYFGRAVIADPRSSRAHGGLGAVYMSQGKVEDGLRELRKAVALDPKSFEQRASLAHALAHAHRNDEAIPLCEALLKEKPDAELFNNLGGLYGETGQLEKAATAFQAALQIDPNNLTAQGNYAKAQAYIERRRQH